MSDNNEFETEESEKRKLPVWTLPVLVGLILALTAGLLLFHYFAPDVPEEPVSASSEPVHTPIPGPDGEPAPMDVFFVDVGNGCCTILKTADGHAMLVDAGHENDVPDICELLDREGIRSFDIAVVSCADKGHMGGMASILSEYLADVCYMTSECAESPAVRPLVQILKQRGIPVETVRASYTSVFDWTENVQIRILSPFDAVYDNEKDLSLMLRVSYGGTAVLLAGDAQKVAERLSVKALPNSMLKSAVLLVGDHGDNDATGEKFLSAVRPRIAVISCGKNNPPDASVLRSLEKAGARIIDTETSGTIHITLDGAEVSVIE